MKYRFAVFHQRGFTLIELMMVIAIIGLLSAVALPQYTTFQKRARFSEVITATSQYKTAADLAVQLVRITALEDLDAGNSGIPMNRSGASFAGEYIQSVSMIDGKITATGTNAVDFATYTLEASFVPGVKGIRWLQDDSAATSCFNLGLC